MAAYVYMVRCANGSLYTGWTTDLSARLKAHVSGKGAKFTHAFHALSMVYYEELPGKSEALKRECAIKKLTKKEKEALVKTFAAGSLPLSACKAKNPSAALWLTRSRENGLRIFSRSFFLSHLSGLFARKKGTGQVPFSSAAIFYEAISAVKTFLKTEGHLHHERRDVCVSDKQDENCFESSENRSFFYALLLLCPWKP